MINVETLAADEFRKRLKTRGTISSSIRFGVRGGGCEGFTFSISFEDDEAKDRDVSWTVDGVKFVTDTKSLIFLSGSTVSWKSDGMSSGFDIKNPNETSKCGCGRSFNVR